MRLHVAKNLLKYHESQEHEDWMLFVAADHINSVSSHDLDPLNVVTLNMKVGQRAVQVSTFIPASDYLHRG